MRLTALEVLPRVGDASCVSALLKVSTESDEQLTQAAKTALQNLPGEEVDQQLAARLQNADGSLRGVLIDLAGRRRIAAAKQALIAAADDTDAGIRATALAAILVRLRPSRKSR